MINKMVDLAEYKKHKVDIKKDGNKYINNIRIKFYKELTIQLGIDASIALEFANSEEDTLIEMYNDKQFPIAEYANFKENCGDIFAKTI